jgi:ATP-dependent exoDNAse (exonuclease V) alpha subunit
MFLENSRKFDVKNWQSAVVDATDGNFLRVRFDDGMESTIDASEYDKVDYVYAITAHKSQGKTVDRVIVVADKMMDASATYVAMTRHRKDAVMLYKTSDFQDVKALAKCLSKYRQKDFLADYRLSDNSNKARVYEYKNSLIEISEVLHDINVGKSNCPAPL